MNSDKTNYAISINKIDDSIYEGGIFGETKNYHEIFFYVDNMNTQSLPISTSKKTKKGYVALVRLVDKICPNGQAKLVIEDVMRGGQALYIPEFENRVMNELVNYAKNSGYCGIELRPSYEMLAYHGHHKVIKELSYKKNDNGDYSVYIKGLTSQVYQQDYSIEESRLELFFGKQVADKLVSNEGDNSLEKLQAKGFKTIKNLHIGPNEKKEIVTFYQTTLPDALALAKKQYQYDLPGFIANRLKRQTSSNCTI